MRYWEYTHTTLDEQTGELHNARILVDTNYLRGVEWLDWESNMGVDLTFKDFLRMWVKSKRAKEVYREDF